MPKSVFALGLDPAFVDLSEFPEFTPELVRAFIDSQMERLRNLGYDLDTCLVDTGETAEDVVAQHLASKSFDVVLIGAGLRERDQLLLFERLLNLIHSQAPNAKICFNTTPADSAEAVQRWT
jgi:hypothetical protein